MAKTKTYELEDDHVLALHAAIHPVAQPKTVPKLGSLPWHKMRFAAGALAALESQMPAEILRELAPDAKPAKEAAEGEPPAETAKKGLFGK